MKWLIYLLLLTNLAFFAWNYRQVHALTSTAATGDTADGVPRLHLLGETAETSVAPNRAAGQADAARADVVPAAVQCTNLGPFERRDAAVAAVAELKNNEINARVRTEALPDRDGFWVVIPPADSRAAAQKTIDALRHKGVKDYFLVAAGDMKNAISLGVFSTRALANQRVAEMERKGFKPQRQSVALPQRRYWVEWPADSGSSHALQSIREAHPDWSVTEQRCTPR